MLASHLYQSTGTPHNSEPNPDTLEPLKSQAKLYEKLHFHSKEIRQQFVTRLHYFVNSSSLHGVRFLDQQYGAIDR